MVVVPGIFGRMGRLGRSEGKRFMYEELLRALNKDIPKIIMSFLKILGACGQNLSGIANAKTVLA